MILTSTRNFLLLCAIGLAATPASARTLNKAAEISNPSISEAQFTDMSARRRHHVARRAVHRKARMVRLLRLQPAMIDQHGVAANSHVAGNSYAAATPSGAISDVGGTGVVSEARRYIGSNPTGRSALWCGHFMNMVLERSGHRGSGSNMARSFASYGTRVSGPQVGAIAVMSRGKRGGHVGVVSGMDSHGNPIIISGNHGRRVAETVYPRGRIYAYVMP